MEEYHELEPEGDVILVVYEGEGHEDGKYESEAVRIRASSRHLMLASRVFSAMLRHSYFREGAELRAHGAVEVELHDDNAQALLTALMVVHGRLRRVPRAVDLAALGHIAIIIDKYGLHEALREHGNMWFNRLQKQDRDTGTARHRRFLWWLVVAWVLRHGNNFRTLTRIAQQNWDGPLGTGAQPRIPSGFPVPATVLDKIEEARQRAISQALTHVTEIVDEYKGSLKHCRHATRGASCDAMTLGKLVRELKRNGLDPLPSSPYHGLSFKGLADRLQAVHLTSLCEELKRPSSASVCTSAQGKVVVRINRFVLIVARTELSGLDLPAETL